MVGFFAEKGDGSPSGDPVAGRVLIRFHHRKRYKENGSIDRVSFVVAQGGLRGRGFNNKKKR